MLEPGGIFIVYPFDLDQVVHTEFGGGCDSPFLGKDGLGRRHPRPQSSASLRFAKTRSRPPERHRPTLTPVRARFGDQWRAPDRDRPFWFGGLDRSLGGPRNGWGWRRRRRSQKNGRWDGRFLQRLNSRCQRLDLIRHAFQIVLLRADVTVDLSNLITCLLLRGPNLQECLPVFR